MAWFGWDAWFLGVLNVSSSVVWHEWMYIWVLTPNVSFLIYLSIIELAYHGTLTRKWKNSGAIIILKVFSILVSRSGAWFTRYGFTIPLSQWHPMISCSVSFCEFVIYFRFRQNYDGDEEYNHEIGAGFERVAQSYHRTNPGTSSPRPVGKPPASSVGVSVGCVSIQKCLWS